MEKKKHPLRVISLSARGNDPDLTGADPPILKWGGAPSAPRFRLRARQSASERRGSTRSPRSQRSRAVQAGDTDTLAGQQPRQIVPGTPIREVLRERHAPEKGKMAGVGEGPLGTKLHSSATKVSYPRPTRVKNKAPAPTQVRATPTARPLPAPIPTRVPAASRPRLALEHRDRSLTRRSPAHRPASADHRRADRARG